MRRPTGAVVALAAATTVLTTSAAAPGSTARTAPTTSPAELAALAAGLPRPTARGVELTLADGDRLRLATTRDQREVVSRRYDAATAAWGPVRRVLREPRLYCGGLDARTSAGAVAVIAQCDRGGYADDQAPTSSYALWSADGVRWEARRLRGEAFEEPGISPDGQSAVWPQHERYTTFAAGAGFVTREVDAPGQEYTVTATVDDSERVSFLYGGGSRSVDCALQVRIRTADGPVEAGSLDVADACADVLLANVDATHVLVGDPGTPAYVTVVARSDTASPWTVTRAAPAYAPGLVEHSPRRGEPATLLAARELPLVAVGSPDRHRFLAQTYDEATGRWAAPVEVVRTPARCVFSGSASSDPLAVLVTGLSCRDGRRRSTLELVSTDALTFTTLRRGPRSPVGISPDGAWASVTHRGRTTVLSRERGLVTLGLGASRTCDLVVPSGPDGVLRLTSDGRGRGWPRVLQRSTPDGWTRVSSARARVEPDGRCGFVDAVGYGRPYVWNLAGAVDVGLVVSFRQVDGTWSARIRRAR